MRSRIWVMAALVLGGCGSADLLKVGGNGADAASGSGGTRVEGTGGSGGSHGTGGTGGASAGTGGTSGASCAPGTGTRGCPVPPCLVNLQKDCPPSGACVLQQSGNTANVCYANGVKYLETVTGDVQVLTVTKPGGGTCFTVTIPADGTTVVYRNAAGATVATAYADPTTGVRIDCPGCGTFTTTNGCQLPGNDDSIGASCTMGACK